VSAADVVILVFILLMAAWGYAQGLIVGALSRVGFVGGAVVGSRLAPLLLEEGSRSEFAPLFALGGALLLGALLASVLELVGFQLRLRIGDTLGVMDGLGGAVLVACLGLALVWVLGAVVLHTPGARELRPVAQRSEILRTLNDALPPSGPVLRLLARLDPFPRVEGGAPDVRAPSARILRDPDVRRAGRSVVRVLGTACGLGVQGSGWVADDGVVVTNAHVVAGVDDPDVELRDGSRHDAEAIWFDSRNDLAVLRARGAGAVPALGLDGDEPVGARAAVLGYPENGPFDARAARLGPTSSVLSQDAYGRGPTRRRVTRIRGVVRSGNSGGPAVDDDGQVVATIFAATVGADRRGGFGVPEDIVSQALRRASRPVGTGPCAQ
jgi:hypothetical protein